MAEIGSLVVGGEVNSADADALYLSSPVIAAVFAASEARAKRIGRALDRDGVLVTRALTFFSEPALRLLRAELDCLVLDACADDEGVEQHVRQARGALPDVGIAVVCADGTGRRVPRHLSAGADAAVFDEQVEQTLAAVVRCCAAGQLSVPRSMRHLLAPPALSHREKEVLQLAARGFTNRQIAGSLFLAESTVKTHLSSAFRRLGVQSRREATALIRTTDNDIRQHLLTTASWTAGSRETSMRLHGRFRGAGEEQ